jgi:hypothetical protein
LVILRVFLIEVILVRISFAPATVSRSLCVLSVRRRPARGPAAPYQLPLALKSLSAS